MSHTQSSVFFLVYTPTIRCYPNSLMSISFTRTRNQVVYYLLGGHDIQFFIYMEEDEGETTQMSISLKVSDGFDPATAR